MQCLYGMLVLQAGALFATPQSKPQLALFFTSAKLNNLCTNVSLTFDNPYHYWIQITFQEPDYPHLSLENRKQTIWNVKCHVASIQTCLPVSQSLGLCTI